MTAVECNEVFALLSQYLDQELPADLCERISGHIQGCAPCVEFVESLRKTARLCNELQLPEKPGPLAEQARRELAAAFEKLRSNPI